MKLSNENTPRTKFFAHRDPGEIICGNISPTNFISKPSFSLRKGGGATASYVSNNLSNDLN